MSRRRIDAAGQADAAGRAGARGAATEARAHRSRRRPAVGLAATRAFGAGCAAPIVLAVGLAACGASGALGPGHATSSGARARAAGDDDPAGVAAARAEAMARDDVDALWELLAPATRDGLDRSRLAATLADAREELRAQAEALAARAAGGEVVARARQTLASGEVVGLVRDPEGWRVEGGVLDAAGARAPEDAVAALRRALLRRSLPAVLRLLARSTRAEVEAELERLIDATARPEALDVRIEGDDALVTLPGGGLVRLRREAGEWRVLDVE
jgi:hypothetical protein